MEGEQSDGGEVVDAEYNEDKNRVEYTIETAEGERATLTFYPRLQSHTKLTENAMRQVADQLPGTPVKCGVDPSRPGSLSEVSIVFDVDEVSGGLGVVDE